MEGGAEGALRRTAIASVPAARGGGAERPRPLQQSSAPGIVTEATRVIKEALTIPVRMPRLLLVDDEPDILETVELLVQVRMPEVQVATASNGLAALEVLKQGPFDVVLTDYKMPGMDGAALVQQVRVLWPRTRVLMFTAFMDAGTLAEIHAKVPDLKIVPKPLDVDFLIEQLLVALPLA